MVCVIACSFNYFYTVCLSSVTVFFLLSRFSVYRYFVLKFICEWIYCVFTATYLKEDKNEEESHVRTHTLPYFSSEKESLFFLVNENILIVISFFIFRYIFIRFNNKIFLFRMRCHFENLSSYLTIMIIRKTKQKKEIKIKERKAFYLLFLVHLKNFLE